MRRAKSATHRVEADSAMPRCAAGFGLLRRINYWKFGESFRCQSAATPQILLHESYTGKKPGI